MCHRWQLIEQIFTFCGWVLAAVVDENMAKGAKQYFTQFFCHLRQFWPLFSFLTEQTFTHIFGSRVENQMPFLRIGTNVASVPGRAKIKISVSTNFISIFRNLEQL